MNAFTIHTLETAPAESKPLLEQALKSNGIAALAKLS